MIPVDAIIGLNKLLRGWGISPDDWYVTGEAAMILSDYPITFREQIIDALVCRQVWPWKRPEEEASLFPPKNSIEEKQLIAFIKQFGFTPDFHPLPHVGLRTEDRFDHTYIYPSSNNTRVLSPWAGIYHRECIIKFYENDENNGLTSFDQKKFIRWKKFVEEIKCHAQKIADGKTIAACEQVLPIVERAINFFEKMPDTSGNAGMISGLVAFAGKANGRVASWEKGANLKDKIVVMEAALPHHFQELSHAAGIVTDQGGMLSHAAVIAREYKIPCVINTKIATKIFKPDDWAEINGGIVKKIN